MDCDFCGKKINDKKYCELEGVEEKNVHLNCLKLMSSWLLLTGDQISKVTNKINKDVRLEKGHKK